MLMQRDAELSRDATTSNRPGYAMAVASPRRAHGAILGKAMTRLEKGKTGMVLVLINLH